MMKRIALLAAMMLLLTCGKDDEVDVSVRISDITNITTSSANVTVLYTAGNVNVTQVGVVYGATPGRLNIRTILNDDGEPNADYGVVSAPPSVSKRFDADLLNLANGTEYFVAPFIKVDKPSSEFPDGYFLPPGWTTLTTALAPGSIPPAVSAVSLSNITYASAGLLATISQSGTPPFIRKGFCYGTSPEPMTNDGISTCVQVHGPETMFSATITGLTGNTAYHARAYVNNNYHSTQYGATTAFRTKGEDEKLIDERDGQEYRIAEVGRFTWMAENLNYQTANSWCYGDDATNCEKYGRLYTWDAARNACPDGWQLPTPAEWNTMIDHAGGAANAGGALKSREWDNSNDNHGFSALPGGYRDRAHVRVYIDIGTFGGWWVDAAQSYRFIQSGRNDVGTGSSNNREYSVRCMKEW